MFESGGKPRDRDRRRVRSENAFRARHVLDPRKSSRFASMSSTIASITVVRRRRRAGYDGGYATDCRIGIRLRQAAFGNLFAKCVRDALLRGVARAETGVVQLDAMAVHCGHLRDARSHRPGADDGDGGARRRRDSHRARSVSGR